MAKKITKSPAAKNPAAKTPVAKTPVAKTPVAKTPVAKTPVAKTPKAKTPKVKAPTAQGRGKRYSNTEKAEILTFVDKHNAEKGRGGAAAASRKYKVSQLTIGNWLKEAGSTSPSRKTKTGDISKVLKRLGDIHKKMAAAEEELGSLRKEYAALKGQL
jgi:hypothetical protein